MKLLDAFSKKVAKATLLLCTLILASRYSSGVAVVAIVVMGLWWGFQEKIGLCVCVYVLCPLLVIFNPMILPKTSVLLMSLRIGPLLMTIALILASTKRSGRERLPMGMLYGYLLMALVSSMGGYCFRVSILKVINFATFLISICIGTSNLDKRPRDLEIIRTFFYAMASIVAFGGLCTLASPAIAYPLNAAWTLRAGGSLAEASEVVQNWNGVTLFAGVTQHSQTLAPLTVAVFGYILCDTLFIMKRITPLSMALLIVLPIELFMTRSRTGLFSVSVALVMTFMFAHGKLNIPQHIKQKISRLTTLLVFIFISAAIVGEVRSGMISRWIFKTNDVAADLSKRSAIESVTSSRSAIVEELLHDFKQNPILGMGFQVNQESPMHVKNKLFVLSAPVEKGLLPLVIIGESGVIGAIVFTLFLTVFFTTCTRRHYIVTATLFSVLLSTNMGEATFFSPGGPGGIIWMYCIVGGFCADMMIKTHQYQRNILFDPPYRY